jgi:hypothetical protein
LLYKRIFLFKKHFSIGPLLLTLKLEHKKVNSPFYTTLLFSMDFYSIISHKKFSVQVHMTEDGYTIVARHITCGLEAMEARRTASEVELDQEAGGSKRARSGSGEATEPKRPLSSLGGYFVERQEFPGGRDRGRPFGGRFNRGGSWPRRGIHYCGNQYY